MIPYGDCYELTTAQLTNCDALVVELVVTASRALNQIFSLIHFKQADRTSVLIVILNAAIYQHKIT